MAAYSDQDELEKLKQWWKNYGTALVAGVALGLVLLFGHKYWRQYTEQRLEAASTLYVQMQQQYRAGDTASARATGTRVVTEHDGTPYAAMAALLLAKVSADAGDMAAARQHLRWVLEHGSEAATVHAARLRLAQILAADGEIDAAMALADTKDAGGFASEYLELKGDLLLRQGRKNEARTAYREALKQLAPDSAYRSVLHMKLDDLGPESAS